MNTTEKGIVAESAIIHRLISMGKTVLTPYGGGKRYDILIEESDAFKKVQIKTGILKDGVIEFRNYSMNVGGSKTYKNDVDYFAVFCPQNNGCYLIPIDKCTSSITTLRIDTPANNNKKRIRWAIDFEI